MTRVTAAQLREEHAYLRERSQKASRIGFGDRRDTGVSSNALVEFGLGGEPPSYSQRPRDRDDLMACYRATRKAPRHMQLRMRPFLKEWRLVLKVEK